MVILCRVGRTARAGRGGRAVTLVGERDIDLVHAIEGRVGSQMTLCEDVKVRSDRCSSPPSLAIMCMYLHVYILKQLHRYFRLIHV